MKHLFSNDELLIAAGLFAIGPSERDDSFYYKWVGYAQELKRRRLSWDAARRLAREMKFKTGYPKRGWEKKYLKLWPTPTGAREERR